MPGRRFLALGLAAGLALAACQIIAGVKDEDGVPRPLDASTTSDALVDADADPCQPQHPPPKPPAPQDPRNNTYVFAIRRFRTTPTSETPLGYDLDDRCTGLPKSSRGGASCVSPTDGGLAIDTLNGVDNAVGASLASLTIVNGGQDPIGAAAENNVKSGDVTNLIVLSGYNGTPNDDAVNVNFILSLGLESTGCDGGTPPDGGPIWDGCDRWSYPPDSGIVGSILPAPRQGYVTDGTLVVFDEATSVNFFGEAFAIHGSVFTARIDREGDVVKGLRDGVIAGRTSPESLLRAIRPIQYKNTVFCQAPDLLDGIRALLCSQRDIPLRQDGVTSDACDAVSFGFGFDADPAVLGSERSTTPSDECADAAAIDLSCGSPADGD